MTPRTDSAVIEGEIIIEQLISSFSDATVYVRLNDVSYADASSRTVAEVIIKNISLNMDNLRPLHFSMNIPALEERLEYSLAVLVDIDGDREISRGDYITKECFPVKRNLPHQYFEIRVSRVE
jgi:uncharacterized lipoprotein YbaY